MWLSQLSLGWLLRLLAAPRRWWWNWSRRHHFAQARVLAREVLRTVHSPADAPSPAAWSVQHFLPTVNDMTVATLGPTGQPPVAILKLPQTHYAAAGLQRQINVLNNLRADPRLDSWRSYLPDLLAQGDIAGRPYAVEKMIPGVEARTLLSNPVIGLQAQTAALAAIGQLHRLTAASQLITSETLKAWVDKPVAELRRLNAARLRLPGHDQALDRLSAELRRALLGQTLCLSWVHGDFAPGNVLVMPDGGTVTGIVDWEMAAPDDLPQLDVQQFLLASRTIRQGRELGDIVRALLRGEEDWTPGEQHLLDAARAALPGEAVELRVAVLLCWLRQAAANLTKSTRYRDHWWWVARNVESVLRSL